jgi:RimJ/RimL family protein N-acetyltransferase
MEDNDLRPPRLCFSNADRAENRQIIAPGDQGYCVHERKVSTLVNIRLEGEFITLRPITVDDAALTLGWRLGARAIHLNAGAQNLEEQAGWIDSRPDSECNFIIELREGRPVGMVSLIGIDSTHRHAESARFLIGDEDAVRGVPVAVEAMKLIYELAFETLGLHRVYGSISSDNALMVKWQKFMGMTEEGRLRNHFFVNGKFQDAVLFGILAEEYRSKALPKMRLLIRAATGTTDSRLP